MLTVEEAQNHIINAAFNFGEEEVSLSEALGRVLAIDVFADRNYPPFNRAAMDGWAFYADDLLNKGIKAFKIAGEIFAGNNFQNQISSGECIKIMTGAPVPCFLDAVVRVEDTESEGDRVVFKVDLVKKYQNIALEGEDIKKDSLVVSRNTFLSSAEIAALAVVGKHKMKVHRLPKVAIISTGNEIKAPDEKVEAYQIRDSNSYSIESFLRKYNIPVAYRKIIADNEHSLRGALREAMACDIVITSGGVSMGSADFLPAVFESLQVEKVFHKVQVKPGKPLWFGKSSGNVIFGLPGNPLSVQVACKVFIEPFLRKSFSLPPLRVLKLPIAVAKQKKTKFDEFFPCRIDVTDTTSLAPVSFNGSGDITATLLSDGLALHNSKSENLAKGEIINFYPWAL